MDKSIIKLFGRWDTDIKVNDKGLERYLNVTPFMIPRSAGRNQKKQFHKSKMNIVERLVNHLSIPGHWGKKHKISSGDLPAAHENTLKVVEMAFGIIEKKLNKNPVEVFVRAIENAAIHEETMSYQMGGIIARKAVITSPQRRIDKALRYICQGAYQKAYGKKIRIHEALANEIINAYNNSNESVAIREKERIEREAASSR